MTFSVYLFPLRTILCEACLWRNRFFHLDEANDGILSERKGQDWQGNTSKELSREKNLRLRASCKPLWPTSCLGGVCSPGRTFP